MNTRADALFIEEAAACRLRFECDDCAHFDDARAACAHGYPVAPHRPTALGENVVVGSTITFCKEFELGDGADGGAP
jgi:hypothetical protein